MPRPQHRQHLVIPYLSCLHPRTCPQLLGQRDTIVAYAVDTALIGSPCADALVADGTITEATTTDAICGAVADNDVLIDLDVNVSFLPSTELFVNQSTDKEATYIRCDQSVWGRSGPISTAKRGFARSMNGSTDVGTQYGSSAPVPGPLVRNKGIRCSGRTFQKVKESLSLPALLNI